jgi:hypothetical protein
MWSCCTTDSKQACPVPQDQPGVCPVCGTKGQSVQVLTVKSLARDHARVSQAASYKFCRSPECDVVYFSTDAIFRKSDLKVRVGLKEKQDPIPLCYCFDYTRDDVRGDFDRHGQTDIPAKIKAEINAGFCSCEVKNPSGKCCLGEVTKAVQEEGKRLLSGQSRQGEALKPGVGNTSLEVVSHGIKKS